MSRLAPAALVAACLALTAAACAGSSGGHLADTGSTGGGWLAFSGCMRSHGVPSYPDPEGSGPPPKRSLQQLGVSSSAFQTAQTACRHRLPNGGQPTQAEEQQVRAQGLEFSRCVRDHGVPNFPDPGGDGRIPDPASAGIDQGSPAFEAANRACGRFRPAYMPSNSAYNSWARAQGGGSTS